MSNLNENQVNTTIFGMASAMFTSIAAMVVTTAVKSNTLVDKTANTLIHGVSAAENVAEAVEKRSKSYSDGLVRNGEIAEREGTLRYELRLWHLENKERRIKEGKEEYVPEGSLADQLKAATEKVKEAVAGSADKAAGTNVKITSAVPAKS